MLRSRFLFLGRTLSRTYATVPGPHPLVFIEHSNGVIDSGSLSAISAAAQLGGKVTALVVGGQDHVPNVLEKAKR
jgi:electron transfer flavoprotein alpha subunit